MENVKLRKMTAFAAALALSAQNGMTVLNAEETVDALNNVENSKNEALKIADSEIENAKSRLSAAGNDIDKATQNFENKLKEKANEMKKKCEEEINSIGDDIKKETEEAINSYFSSNKDLLVSNIEILQLKELPDLSEWRTNK